MLVKLITGKKEGRKEEREGRERGREKRKQVQSELREAHTFFAFSRILSLSKTYTLRHELFKKKKRSPDIMAQEKRGLPSFCRSRGMNAGAFLLAFTSNLQGQH